MAYLNCRRARRSSFDRVGTRWRARSTPANPSCTVEPVDPATLKVGDIVLCKVGGNQYLHLVKAIQGNRFQIGNNRGRINGWVLANGIYGKCVVVERVEVTMNHDDFLRAIIENPDDDALRLVFADWLEERGENDRAEFIRVQIELARLPEGDRRRRRLEEREEELLSRNEEEWVGPIRDRVVSWVFHRGFITEVTVTVQEYLSNGYDIVRLVRSSVCESIHRGVEVSPSVLELIPESVARENLVLPLGHRENSLVVAVPSNT